MNHIFETSRLIIREISNDQFSEFFILYNSQENMKYVSAGKYQWTSKELKEKLEPHMENYSRGFGIYAVVEKSSGKLIGELGLFNSFDLLEELEIGYILDQKFWGRGYGSELLKGAILYALKDLILQKIVARMYAENKASARICEKCGMRLVKSGFSESGKEFIQYEINSNEECAI